MPVCKDCGRQFGDGAYIYHDCKAGLRTVIDNCLVNPAELRKEIADLKRQLEDVKDEHDERGIDIDILVKRNEALRQQLTESQAREARLREALENYKILCQDENHYSHYVDALKALALPHEDTALREYRDSVIEECALELCNFEAGNLAYLIRRLKKD